MDPYLKAKITLLWLAYKIHDSHYCGPNVNGEFLPMKNSSLSHERVGVHKARKWTIDIF